MKLHWKIIIGMLIGVVVGLIINDSFTFSGGLGDAFGKLSPVRRLFIFVFTPLIGPIGDIFIKLLKMLKRLRRRVRIKCPICRADQLSAILQALMIDVVGKTKNRCTQIARDTAISSAAIGPHHKRIKSTTHAPGTLSANQNAVDHRIWQLHRIRHLCMRRAKTRHQRS